MSEATDGCAPLLDDILAGSADLLCAELWRRTDAATIGG